MQPDDTFLLRRSVEMVAADPKAAKEAFTQAAARAYDERMLAEREPRRRSTTVELANTVACVRCGRKHRTPRSCTGTEEYRAMRRAYHKTPEARARRRAAAKNPTPAQVERRLRSMGVQAGYSITVEERDARLDEQEHRCAICRRSFRVPPWHLVCTFVGKAIGRKVPKVMVDHSHETGKVRGLLCNWCNRSVVVLFDKFPEHMVRARRYVIAGGWESA